MTGWGQVPAPFDSFRMPSDTDMNGPGVYTTERDGSRLYVGMASNVWSRLGDHRRAGMLTVIESGAVYPTHSVEAAGRLERALIWLLNPSENENRPSPSGPLWAATLGISRPVSNWRWYLDCGHVELKGRVLVDDVAVSRAGCKCKPWSGWVGAVRSYVDGLEAKIRTEVADQESLSLALEGERLDAEMAATRAQDDAEEREYLFAENVRLREELARLESAREWADWFP